VVINSHTSADDRVGSEQRIPVVAVSRGVAVGRVVFWQNPRTRPLRIHLSANQIDDEAARLKAAGQEAIRQIRELTASANAAVDHPVAGIMDVHLTIIEESSFIEKVESVIRSEYVNAEWALKQVSAEFIAKQSAAADQSLQEKHIDIADVSDRLLQALGGSYGSKASLGAGSIVIAQSLRPSTVVELAKSSPAAIITDRAGWTSHTSILARELGLPMVSGLSDLESIFTPGETIIVDAESGQVILRPMPDTFNEYILQNAAVTSGEYLHSKLRQLETLDGTSITIRANAENPKVYEQAHHLGAHGIGLFRSESLIRVPGNFPSEEDQLSAFMEMADVVGIDGLRIRTFDIERGDLGGDETTRDRNPALGLRSLRLSLFDQARFRVQIRAILRASLNHSVDIVLPMISGLGDVLICKRLILEEKSALESAGVRSGMPMIGAMIEVPSSVLSIREIAANVDFLCLGTNDLVQYLLAVDRDNDAVADWYQTLHPAVISALRQVLSAGDDADIPVTICGEMAGSPFYVPLLIGLGARELSMNANSIGRVRSLVAGITAARCRELTDAVYSLMTAEDIETFLRAYYKEHWSDLFPDGLLNARHR
jgi:phosphoenolpyruvate-protein phosphotransferase (PTS system enzyme I)